MKAAALLVTFLAAAVQANGSEDDGVVSIYGHFVGKCFNTQVIDIGTAGYRKWTLFTYCPRDGGYPGVEIESLDLDECIANDHGSLKWQDQGRFSDSCKSCWTEPAGGNKFFLSCLCKTAQEGWNEDPPQTFDLAYLIAWQSPSLVCRTEFAPV